jgi:hypothetical protein
MAAATGLPVANLYYCQPHCSSLPTNSIYHADAGTIACPSRPCYWFVFLWCLWEISLERKMKLARYLPCNSLLPLPPQPSLSLFVKLHISIGITHYRAASILPLSSILLSAPEKRGKVVELQ